MEQYIFFCSHKKNSEGTEIYSQWYSSKFVDDTGNEYENCEQYMMAQKAILFNDDAILNKIMANSNPKTVKALGRKVKNFDVSIWNESSFEIVKKGNFLKFNSNNTLKDRLLKTSNKTLVEAAWYDKIWGIGLTKANAIKTPVNEWPGQNLLGKALMEVRSIL